MTYSIRLSQEMRDGMKATGTTPDTIRKLIQKRILTLTPDRTDEQNKELQILTLQGI